MSKHTPGPWRVKVDVESSDWSQQWPQIVSDGYCVVGTEGLYGDWNTDMANAKLIAAAPDLLEALQAIINSVPFGSSHQATFERAQAAIKKATE